MIPNPLHPALVHMPLAVVALLPFAALAALLFIRKGAGARAVWSVVVVLHLLVVVGVWAASMSGEAEKRPSRRWCRRRRWKSTRKELSCCCTRRF